MRTHTTALAACAAAAVLAASSLLAHASYIGYSGAPGARGTCASSCHGTTGGTIQVAGFPAVYYPGYGYLISVYYTGRGTIANFNCSIRRGAGVDLAGTLSSGMNTEVYAISPQEPMGVHFANPGQDSGAFWWLAPYPGVGDVTLYLAGLQGSLSDGTNSFVIMTATEGSGINDRAERSATPALSLLNRIVRGYLVLQVNVSPDHDPRLRVWDAYGRNVATIAVPDRNGEQSLIWEPVDGHGRQLEPGSYFVSLVARHCRQTRKFVVVE